MHSYITKLLSKPWFVPAAVGVAAFSGGTGLGYILGKRNMLNQFQGVIADLQTPMPALEEIQELQEVLDFESIPEVPYVPTKHNYRLVVEENEEELVDKYTPAEVPDFQVDDDIREGKAIGVQALKEDPPPRANVFDNVMETDPQWDYEAELALRTERVPYILHRDEFFNDEKGFSQHTLTYYKGDDIMADEQEIPVYNYYDVVGPLKFGHGSLDKNVFYVRNEKLHSEYEVVFATGSYEMEVLGYSIEQEYAKEDLQHSVPRFKRE
jgi:hypothetical protein